MILFYGAHGISEYHFVMCNDILWRTGPKGDTEYVNRAVFGAVLPGNKLAASASGHDSI